MSELLCHDYLHCGIESCPLKDKCFRYKLHLDVIERGLKDKWFSYKADSNNIGENCECFIDMGDEKGNI